MKKLISIIAAIAMLATFAVIPAMAADVTVDFASEDNLAYGMSMTGVSGKNYYAKSSTAPKAGAQYGTDGDITTFHMAATRKNISWGDKVGSEVYVDLGDTKTVTKVTLYAQPLMSDGSMDRSNSGLKINVHVGNSSAGTLIGQMNIPTETDVVNGLEVYAYTIDFPANTSCNTITFALTSSYYWGWNEIYVEGAASTLTDADKVAADKEALDLGDTSALTANLTLPTSGATYGSTISWATSDASVITNAGVINRVGEDKTVTLTATITNGDVTDTKTFDVTVKGYEVYNIDLSAENNILAGKVVTPIAGRYFSSTGGPTDANQYATDGILETGFSGNGKVSGATTGVSFSIDLEDEYLVDNVTLLLASNHFDRAVKIYNGAAVDETKLLGTYSCAVAAPNYVVAGEQGRALAVLSCDLPDFTKASQLTIAYEGGYDFAYYEIVATGSKPQEGVTYVDFKSSDNLAYGKDNARVIGHFYDGWNPASDDRATDGDITTVKRCTGAYSGSEDDSYYGSAFRIDLGAYYDLTELTLYTQTAIPAKIHFRSEDAFTTTGAGQSSSKWGYILNSLGGELHVNGFATINEGEGELVNVNGTQVYKNSADLSNNAQPVRYIIVHLAGGTFEYNELYVAGTPATGLAFAEGDFVYADGQVTAEVKLMNLTEEPATGNLYFAAYDADGALVGIKNYGVVSADAGATVTVNSSAFAASAKATYVKAFYWADGTYVPVIADIICD